MSLLVLNDKTEHYLDDKQTDQVNKELAKSGDGFIQVAGLTIKKTAIQQIKPGGKTQADMFDDPWAEPDHQIEEHKCQGSQSIQREINRIAEDEGGRGWAKLITNKKWREETRLKLRAMRDGWCDSKANECVCYET